MNKYTVFPKQYSTPAGVFSVGLLGGFLLFAFAYLVATDPGGNLTLVESGVRVAATGERFLAVTLRNNTGAPYAFVQADLSVVDDAGHVVRDTIVTARDLSPGQTWRFEVALRAGEATRAILDGQGGRRYDFHGETVLRYPDGFVTGDAGEARSPHAPPPRPAKISRPHGMIRPGSCGSRGADAYSSAPRTATVRLEAGARVSTRRPIWNDSSEA